MGPTFDAGTTTTQPVVTLRRTTGEAVPFTLEARDDSWLLRPSEDMAVGAYELEGVLSCVTSGKFTTKIVVAPTAAEVTTLGDLTLESGGTCPNVNVTLTLNLSESARQYLPFVELDLQDDLGSSWNQGLFPLSNLYGYQSVGTPVYFRGSAACGEQDGHIRLGPLVPHGDRAVTARSRLVDGPELPALHAEASVVCGDCPSPLGHAAADAGVADIDAGPPSPPLETDYGCTLAAGAERRGTWAASALLALTVLVCARRSRETQRD